MKKSIALILTLVLILSVLLTGCSSSVLDPKNPITLTMWHNYGGDMQSTMDYLIDEFNATVGKDKGIIINVTAISSSSELNKSLDMIANGDPGAPDMPDIFTGYPKVAIQFQEKGMLVNFDDYFTEDELSAYVEDFVAEGRLADGGLYVFPIAKSTEVLYVNQTLFDRFSAATGAKMDDLATFEGIARLSEQYYEYSGGKQFYAADSWFNYAEVGMAQLGTSIFNGEALSLRETAFPISSTRYIPLRWRAALPSTTAIPPTSPRPETLFALPVRLRVFCSTAIPSPIPTARWRAWNTVSCRIPYLRTAPRPPFSAEAA